LKLNDWNKQLGKQLQKVHLINVCIVEGENGMLLSLLEQNFGVLDIGMHTCLVF